MNVIKRAGLYTFRQKQRSILLFLILVLVSSLVLTGIATRSAIGHTFTSMHRDIARKIDLERNLPELDHDELMRYFLGEEEDSDGTSTPARGVFEQLNSGDFVTFDILEAIRAIPGITEYSIAAELRLREVLPENFDFLSDRESQIATGEGEITMTTIAELQSASNTELMDAFLNNNLQLVEGRHLTSGDVGKVMISDDLAQHNNLQIGDTLRFSGTPMVMGVDDASNVNFEFEVVGIFTGTRVLEEDEITGFDHMMDPSILNADTLIIDMMTLLEIHEQTDYFGTGVAGSLPGPVSIFTHDPNDIESVYDQIANLPEMVGQDFSLTLGTAGFETVLESFDSLQGLIVALLVIIALVSLAIVAILLTIWSRGRTREMGIYLANGIKKGEIIGQFMFEAVLIAMVAFALSFPISQIIAESTSDYIIDQFVTAQELREEQLEGSQMFTANEGGFHIALPETGLMTVANIENMLDRVDVSISGRDLIGVYAIGLPVVMGSVLIASYSVVKLKPKEILTKMS